MNRRTTPVRRVLRKAAQAGVASPKAAPVPLSEHQLQRAFAQYLDRALPPDAWWTSIDSAGRGPIAGAKMKARGVRKGLLDALILWRDETIWFELKSAKGRVTPEQRDFMNRALMAGHACYVIRNVEAVELHLMAHRIPLRARLT